MIGIDICEVARFENLKNLDAFLQKYFTEQENEYIKSKNSPQSAAGIFAAKESVAKALGGFCNFSLFDIEILHEESGKPFVKFSEKLCEKVKDKNVQISISHEKNYAVAICIMF